MLLALVAGALAAPTMTTANDGSVTGVVEVPMSPEALRARLGDPTWLPSISKDGTSVSVAAREGECLIVDSVSPSAVMTVRYRTRQCPTPQGFQSTLVHSDQFSEYATSWTVTPTASGARATYHIRLSSNLWIPDAVVRRGVRGGIEQMLTNLEAWAKSQPRP